MKIITNNEKLENDIFDVCHLFYEGEQNDEKPFIYHTLTQSKNIVKNEYTIEDETEKYTFCEECKLKESKDVLEEKRQIKRAAKLALYKMLSKHFSRNLPWGSLTGIRPTKVGYDLINSGIDICMVNDALIDNFLVSPEKAKLVQNVIRNQKCIIRNDNLVDLYINIPVCPTRCSYCTFISAELCNVSKIMDDYVDCLIKEIDATKKIIFDNAYVLRTIYIGGGTPTTLTSAQLEKLLSNINYPVNEFTVECGRPDTITEEKLKILKKYGVTRISINPQTFNDAVLKKIGRKHTTKDIITAYKTAIPFDFVVNMDLIAGLPGDKLKSFKNSIDTAIMLSPDNITVHSLSLKNGSVITQSGAKSSCLADKMIKYSNEQLSQNGYKPYYLYRQKNQSAGQENVGYFRENVCLFNVDSMEESLSILACGANAISKRVYSLNNRIERFANCKELKDYIARIDEMIAKKQNLFSNKH